MTRLVVITRRLMRNPATGGAFARATGRHRKMRRPVAIDFAPAP